MKTKAARRGWAACWHAGSVVAALPRCAARSSCPCAAGEAARRPLRLRVGLQTTREDADAQPSFARFCVCCRRALARWLWCRQLRNVFEPSLLRAARDELIREVTATYKETDLFKVFQTGDLGNLDALPAEVASKIPSLRAVRDAIYSAPFRAAVASLCGIEPHTLLQRPDCSVNCYPPSGHLLCHDDVISTRRVSYILYLTEPDEAWTEADGGALEIYGSAEGGVEGAPSVPSCRPTTSLLPEWNSMAMFAVLPGRSFHSVAEVSPARGRQRLSLSGWFHAATPPAGAAAASLEQIKLAGAPPPAPALGGESDGGSNVGDAGELGELTAADLEALAPWVSAPYLSVEAAANVRARFADEDSVALRSFLRADRAGPILEATARADEALGRSVSECAAHGAGVRGGWAEVGPPHLRRFLQFDPAAAARAEGGMGAADAEQAAGEALAACARELLRQPAFARYVRHVCQARPLRPLEPRLRRFRPGLDYTVAVCGESSESGGGEAGGSSAAAPQGASASHWLDMGLCFVTGKPGEDSPWAGGDVGGFETYLAAQEDEGQGADDVYAGGEGAGEGEGDDDDAPVLSLEPQPNCLVLALRAPRCLHFVKYVSAAAPGSRWDVACSVPVQDESPDTDEEESDEDDD